MKPPRSYKNKYTLTIRNLQADREVSIAVPSRAQAVLTCIVMCGASLTLMPCIETDLRAAHTARLSGLGMLCTIECTTQKKPPSRISASTGHQKV